MHDFKQKSGFAFRHTVPPLQWQKSYYDHVLRREDDVVVVARYIVANPVRAGLASAAGEYPFTGSFVWGRAIVEA